MLARPLTGMAGRLAACVIKLSAITAVHAQLGIPDFLGPGGSTSTLAPTAILAAAPVWTGGAEVSGNAVYTLGGSAAYVAEGITISDTSSMNEASATITTNVQVGDGRSWLRNFFWH